MTIIAIERIRKFLTYCITTFIIFLLSLLLMISYEFYVKIVNDVYIKDIDNPYKEIIFTDNNTTGESIDPTLLLYIGGEDIIASTIA